MICPSCGTVDEATAVPEFSYEPELLGSCSNCDEQIVAAGTTKKWEPNKLATVRSGEKQEEMLMDVVVDNFPDAESHEDRGRFKDIDRAVYDSDGNPIFFAEIKERTCTLNGYRETKFPYAKIESAKELAEEHGVPVHIILKFRDAWARLTVDTDKDYSKGDSPFAPNYRPEQEDKERQVPVEYPVEQLDVIGTQQFCDTADDLL